MFVGGEDLDTRLMDCVADEFRKEQSRASISARTVWRYNA